ncbi:MAG: hypothetical protein ACI4GB_03930 [Acutalibacteraceae bacterium]
MLTTGRSAIAGMLMNHDFSCQPPISLTKCLRHCCPTYGYPIKRL